MKTPLNTFIWVVVLMLVAATSAPAATWDLNYAGRIVDATGAPVAGPVTLRAKFYRSETGGTAVNVTQADFINVTLADGIFQIAFALSDADRQTLFNGIDPVYVEISDVTRSVTYPRQVFGVVPYALKVPIDEKVLAFDVDGKLTLSAAPQTGKFLSANAQGELEWLPVPGGGDMLKSGNLTGLTNLSLARTNLGLGDAATKNSGTGAGTVAAGDHTHADVTGAISGFMSAADKTKLDGISAGAGVVNTASVDAAGAAMNSDFTSQGLMLRGATSGSYSILTDNSTNWNTAYTERLQWDGSSVGNAAAQLAARGNLGLGSAASQDSSAMAITGGSVTGLTTLSGGNFASTGIDDNADALAMTIDSSEHVGIGTTAPGAALEVNTTSLPMILRKTNAGSSVDLSFRGIDSGSAARTMNLALEPMSGTNQSYLAFYNSSGTPNMVVRSDGNVGIGTAAPISTLDVMTPAAAGAETLTYFRVSDAPIPNLAIRNGMTGGNNFAPVIDGDNYTAGTGYAGLTLVGRFLASDDSGTTPSVLVKGYRRDGANSTTRPIFGIQKYDNTQVLTVGPTGNLGIGTTTPAASLDVAGASGIRAYQICDETGANCKDISTGWGGTGDMLKTDNLSGLANYTTARSNLGLGGAATLNVGTGAGSVAAGDHTHADATTSVAGFLSAADKTKLDDVATGADDVNSTTVAAAGAAMDSDFASQGIMLRGATAGSYSILTNSSTDWNTAYTERATWDGSAVGNAAAQLAARGNIGLGSIATQDASTVSITGGSVTGLTTLSGGNFASTGIDDNADALAMTIDSSERVGIGTTSPAAKLHVSSGDILLDDVRWVKFGTGSTTGLLGSSQPGAEGLAFYAAASEKMRITNTGNVGIGSANPQSALDIAGVSGIRAYQICDEGGNNCKDLSDGWGGTGDMLKTDNLSGLANYTTARSNLGLGTVATQDAGAVAITGGTVSGLTSLGVSGTAFTSQMPMIIADGTTGASTTSSSLIVNVNPSVTDGGYFAAYDATAWRSGGNAATIDSLAAYTGNYGHASGAVASRATTNLYGLHLKPQFWGGTFTNAYGIRIDTPTGGTSTVTNNFGLYQADTAAKNYFAGSVGIGSTNPQSALDIAGVTGIRAYQICDETGSNCKDLSAGWGSGDVVSGGQNGALTIGTNNSNNLTFETNNSPRMTLDTSGNVGIGSASPTQKLDVNGTGKFTDLITTSSISSPGASYGSEQFGSGAVAAQDSLAVGRDASAVLSGGSVGAIAIGRSATSTGGIAIGRNSSTLGGGAIALGQNALAGAAVGSNPQQSIALGNNTAAGGMASIALGYGAENTDNNQLVIGGSTGGFGVNKAYFGPVTLASPADFTFNATGGSGTDVAGASLIVAAGKGTGAGNGGSLIFQTAAPGSTGSSLNALSERLRITPSGNVGIGTTSPQGKLHVALGNDTNIVHFTSGGVANITSVNDANSVEKNLNIHAVDLGLAVGRVHIGGTSPDANLTVTDTGNGIHVSNYSDQDFSLKNSAVGATDKFSYIGSNQATNLVLGVAGEKVRITSAGNVGIGTTAPTVQLEVKGLAANIKAKGTETDGSTGWPAIVIENDTGHQIDLTMSPSNCFGSLNCVGNNLAMLETQDTDLIIATDNTAANGGTHAIKFSTGGYDLATQTRMTINAAGNVGIGTTSPTEKLEVTGNLNLSGGILPAPTWTAPSLQNSWVDFGGGYAGAGYLKDKLGFVHLHGTIKSGSCTSNTVLFTLPAGFRPNAILEFASPIDGAVSSGNGVVDVNGDGTVTVPSTARCSTTYLNLNGISFLSEQ